MKPNETLSVAQAGRPNKPAESGDAKPVMEGWHVKRDLKYSDGVRDWLKRSHYLKNHELLLSKYVVDSGYTAI